MNMIYIYIHTIYIYIFVCFLKPFMFNSFLHGGISLLPEVVLVGDQSVGKTALVMCEAQVTAMAQIPGKRREEVDRENYRI